MQGCVERVGKTLRDGADVEGDRFSANAEAVGGVNGHGIAACGGDAAVNEAGGGVQRESGGQIVGAVAGWCAGGFELMPEVHALVGLDRLRGDVRSGGGLSDDDLVDPALVLAFHHLLVLGVVDVHVVRPVAEISGGGGPVGLASDVVFDITIHGEHEVVVVLLRRDLPLELELRGAVHGELDARILLMRHHRSLDGVHAVVSSSGLAERIAETEGNDLRGERLLHGGREQRIGGEDQVIGELFSSAGGVGGALITLEQARFGGCAGDEAGRGVERQPVRQTAGKVSARAKARGEVCRGDLVLQVPAFATHDDPVGRDGRHRQRRVRGRAVEGERHVIQRAGVVDHAVKDLQLPVALGAFAPEMRRHEGPVEIRGVVAEACACQSHLHTAGRGETPLQIARIRMRGLYFHGDVLQPQIVHGGDGESAGGAVFIRVRDRLREVGLRQHAGLQRRDAGPSLRHVRGGLCVHQACAVAVVEVKAAAVRHPATIELVVLRGGAHQDLLHIAVSQVRVRLKHERHHTCGGGRGGGGAAKGVRVVRIREVGILDRTTFLIVTRGAETVGGGDALLAAVRRCAHEDVRAWLAVPRGSAFVIDGRNSDGVGRVRPAIVVRVVTAVVAVPSRPQEDRAFAAATVRHRVRHRRETQRTGTARAVGIVVRPPTVALDVDDVLLERERIRLVCVRGRCSDEFQADHSRLWRDTAHTDAVVASRRRHTRTGCAMKILRPRGGIIIEVVEVVVVEEIDIGRQIGMRDL